MAYTLVLLKSVMFTETCAIFLSSILTPIATQYLRPPPMKRMRFAILSAISRLGVCQAYILCNQKLGTRTNGQLLRQSDGDDTGPKSGFHLASCILCRHALKLAFADLCEVLAIWSRGENTHTRKMENHTAQKRFWPFLSRILSGIFHCTTANRNKRDDINATHPRMLSFVGI